MKGYKKIKSLLQNRKHKNKSKDQSSEDKSSVLPEKPFYPDLKHNKEYVLERFGQAPDLIIHELPITLVNGQKLAALLFGINGLINEEVIREHVLEPLISQQIEKPNNELEQISSKLSVQKMRIINDLDNALIELLKGHVLLLFEGYIRGLLIDVVALEERPITEPESEKAVRGARDGFVESTATNIALLRQRIAHPSLRIEKMILGTYSQTTIVISYMQDIAASELVNRVKSRLKQIDMDAINNSGEIEQAIEDHPYTIFPTIGNTERPDRAASLLMEGRVLLFVSGNPTCLYVPLLFLENLQSIEDYQSRPFYSSFTRLLRFMAFIVSVALPGIYIAALNFHKEIIPSAMIVPIIEARETVPFPLMMELLLMILMFEVVREAGVRLPLEIGSALSIVGALILGEVSVSAGIVGAPTIIVVSISYIASFLISPIADVTALLRLGLFIVSSIFGAYGLIISLLGLITHMVSLTSMGVPYLAPFAPFYIQDLKDTIFRFPLRWHKKRAKSIPHKRKVKIRSLPKQGDH